MERHRIDHWLKLVCLFKQRGDAAEACRGGHIKVNGQRIKPSTTIKEDDVIEFLQGTRQRRVVVVAMPESSVSKEVARTMYRDESPEPIVAPAQTKVWREQGSGRPTKKERREINRFRR